MLCNNWFHCLCIIKNLKTDFKHGIPMFLLYDKRVYRDLGCVIRVVCDTYVDALCICDVDPWEIFVAIVVRCVVDYVRFLFPLYDFVKQSAVQNSMSCMLAIFKLFFFFL